MRTTKPFLAKVLGSVIGAATLLQASTCNVQFPPDNTDCFPAGVCIAWGKQAAFLDGAFVGDSLEAEVAGD